MRSAARNPDGPEQRLLSDLAALGRMTGDPGPRGLSRLEAHIGAERARFLVRALSRQAPSRDGEGISPSASA